MRKKLSMRNIAELTVLFRERVALPDHFKLVTEEFREGWDFVRSGDVHGWTKRPEGADGISSGLLKDR
jgi:hypothetical protein